ncbi:MAG: glutamate racemase [Ruminococcaceae bacterium]|nr:glutamate racemase [Oscillospiraceae bacterium]
MKDSYIGVFDSGIGGLTVVKEIVRLMPNENIIYLGDTAHVPYGTHSPEQITEYALQDTKFLSAFNLKAIVIACNTVDSIAREAVDELCNVPVFGVVEPASKVAANTTKNGKIGVIATNATVNSRAYNKAIEKYNLKAEVISVACPLLVPLIENGQFKKGDTVTRNVLKEYLDPLMKQEIDTLILGCTHYTLLTEMIEDLYPNLMIVSSSIAVAKTIKASLPLSGNEQVDRRYFVSNNVEDFKKLAQIFMGEVLTENIEQVQLG